MDRNEKSNAPDDPLIPPGWDFPDARAAAADGVDLWHLDSNLQLSPWERIERNFEIIAMADLIEARIAEATKGGLQAPLPPPAGT